MLIVCGATIVAQGKDKKDMWRGGIEKLLKRAELKNIFVICKFGKNLGKNGNILTGGDIISDRDCALSI